MLHPLIYQGCYRTWAAHSDSRRGRSTYTPGQIDFIVAYVIPESAWYVFPIDIIGTRACLKLFPHHRPSRSRCEQYREAWNLMYPGHGRAWRLLAHRSCAPET